MLAREFSDHFSEVDILERLHLLEVIVAVGLLQQFLVLSYFAVVQRVQEFKLALALVPASLRFPRLCRHPRFGPPPGLDNLEVLRISGCLVHVWV